jgi:hypothetical protein
MIFIVAVGFGIFSCSRGQDSGSSEEISGVYVRQYSFKVVNSETGAEIGIRTIRDTIFIQTTENGYEVSNRKWKLNEYDKAGWQSMQHSEDRPVPTYQAIFNHSGNSLTSELMVPLYIVANGKTLIRGTEDSLAYQKLR